MIALNGYPSSWYKYGYSRVRWDTSSGERKGYHNCQPEQFHSYKLTLRIIVKHFTLYFTFQWLGNS